jgi:hypothetical protein
MSMLIMSVGVSFVAAVFPLALLKSVQSTQMTNATVLFYQARSLIEMMPNRLHNPNGDPRQAGGGFANDNPRTFSEHFSSNYIIDPWGYFIHDQDGSDTQFPVRPEMLPPFDDTAVAQRPALVGFPFGNVGTDDSVPVFPGARSLERFDGGIRADTFTQPVNAAWESYRERLGATLSSSVDRWGPPLETDSILSVDSQSIVLDPSVDLTGLPVRVAPPAGALIIPDPDTVRITLFHENGRESQAYPVTMVDGNVVHWGEAAGDFNLNGTIDDRILPNNYFVGARTAGGTAFDATRVSHITIEINLIRQFSWFLTVRKDGAGAATVDAVMVFNRRVDPINEHAYRAVFRGGTNTVLVEFADPGRAAEPEPFMKKGGYVFDANNAEWYRIRDVQEFGPGTYDAVLTVEGPVRRSSGEDTVDADQALTNEDANNNGVLDSGEDLNGNGRLDFEDANRNGVFDYGTAIFLPGVLEVFPMGRFSLPENVL